MINFERSKMEQILREIERDIFIGETKVSVEDILSTYSDGQILTVHLPKAKMQRPNYTEYQTDGAKVVRTIVTPIVNHTYIMKVKQYMTKPSMDPSFDFMAKWNNNEPMPFMTMKCRVLKETRGMVMVEACAVPLKTDRCMRCGRPLTHPVSRLYGVGPECGAHAYLNPFNTEEELNAALDHVKASLAKVKWRGWIIKTAIEECQEIK
jgi:hypothetical protein